MEASKLEKGKWYIINNFGVNIPARLLDSPRQGRGWKQSVFMDVKGSVAGFVDEMGGVYVKDIVSLIEN